MNHGVDINPHQPIQTHIFALSKLPVILLHLLAVVCTEKLHKQIKWSVCGDNVESIMRKPFSYITYPTYPFRQLQLHPLPASSLAQIRHLNYLLVEYLSDMIVDCWGMLRSNHVNLNGAKMSFDRLFGVNFHIYRMKFSNTVIKSWLC